MGHRPQSIEIVPYLKQKKDPILRTTLIAALVISAAVLCRRIVLVTGNGYIEQLANLFRIFLYLGLFAMWGISVQRRVVQPQVRRYLVTVAVFMILWLMTRELRWHMVFDGDIKRFLWYLYYVPMLMIPLLALFVSLSKPGAGRLPKAAGVLYATTVAFILLVLTNDLHQFVFCFPGGEAWTDANYSYAPGFYMLSVWSILLAAAALIFMLKRCRLPRTGRFLWLPLIPFGAAVLYIVLYASRVPFVRSMLGDLAVTECLLFAAFFECCIVSGLIQSNAHYADLFAACSGVSVQITDNDYITRYAASSAEPIAKADMISAEAGPVILPGGIRLHNMSVSGGHAIWTEDISELTDVRESLEETQEELNERKEFLEQEYEQEKEYRRVMEQNRLYDLLQKQIQPQLDEVARLTDGYETASGEAEKRSILAKLLILGSYIKRRKDFVLLMEGSDSIPESRLTSALEESFRSLASGGIRGAYLVHTGRESVNGAVLTLAYDFFESVLETALDTVRYITVHVTEEDGGLQCRVMTDCSVDTAGLLQRYPKMRAFGEAEGSCCVLPLTGGDGA